MYKQPENIAKKNLDLNSKLKIFQIYKNLKYTSLKLDSYFQVYEEIFKKYVGKKITFVEVGVLGGGSLFMWRDYFGKDARIIGIDLNPDAEKWKKHGFEIFIGSQSNEKFWNNFYKEVGKIDILLDDGGHHNNQQITSVHASIPNINNEGVIVVEDTHSSYMSSFGNPSKFSFINFSKYVVDKINYRFPLTNPKMRQKKEGRIFSVTFYESIVAFNINSEKCFDPEHVNSAGDPYAVPDFSSKELFPRVQKIIDKQLPVLKKIPVIKKIVRLLFYKNNLFLKIKEFLFLRKFFK
tara:strand:- start:328 stop:1209 length:882 start_codon:yes stop_codon:yes gene_type:complete